MEETARQFTNPFSGETRSVPEGVVLREGRSDDQERINELCREVNFVSGWDFMPGLWVTWMNNPDTTIVVVAEAGGKVVSVAGLLVANKGKHFISFGSRSSPTVRGKNVFWACCAHKITLGIQRYGCPEKFMTVACNFQIAQKTREGGRMNYKAVGYKTYFFAGHRISAADLQRMSDHVTSYVQNTISCDVSIVQTPDEVAKLFADNDTSFTLFPEGHFKIMYAVFEAIPQTAYDVWDPNLRQFSIARNSQGMVTSFSVLTTQSVDGRQGTSMELEVYGDCGVDAVLSHMRAQLPYIRRAYERYGGEMYMMINMLAHYDKEPLMKVCRDKMKIPCIPGDIAVMLSYDQPKLAA